MRAAAEVVADEVDKRAHLGAHEPTWMAYDLRAMMRRYQDDGAVASPAEIDRLTTLLGHSPRNYRDFAHETARDRKS